MSIIKEILSEASKKIRSVTQNPRKEAMVLLASSLHVDILWLVMHEDDNVDIPKDFIENIAKREEFYPLEYLLKSTSFYAKEFYTDERVLIPRPETEILIDKVVFTCKGIHKPRIVEVGTGSGIISIMLSILVPDAKILATDISEDALEVALINARKHGAEQRIQFRKSNLLDSIDEKIDIVVSNPPYIKNDEILEKNLSYEPDIALFGGDKGDEILKKIIDEALERNVRYLACEMGYDQKNKIANYIDASNLEIEFYQDLAGIDRGFVLGGFSSP